MVCLGKRCRHAPKAQTKNKKTCRCSLPCSYVGSLWTFVWYCTVCVVFVCSSTPFVMVRHGPQRRKRLNQEQQENENTSCVRHHRQVPNSRARQFFIDVAGKTWKIWQKKRFFDFVGVKISKAVDFRINRHKEADAGWWRDRDTQANARWSQMGWLWALPLSNAAATHGVLDQATTYIKGLWSAWPKYSM